MSIPQLSSEQLVAAREAATHARRARAELKEAVRTGKVSFVEALEKASGDEVLSRIKVVDLLRAVPRVGATRAQSWISCRSHRIVASADWAGTRSSGSASSSDTPDLR